MAKVSIQDEIKELKEKIRALREKIREMFRALKNDENKLSDILKEECELQKQRLQLAFLMLSNKLDSKYAMSQPAKFKRRGNLVNFEQFCAINNRLLNEAASMEIYGVMKAIVEPDDTDDGGSK